ncbi:DUF692 family protein [Streptomyces sp. DT2A-34]|uniref:multinuclear nonheme iron-dependent oxidase n=1 Tax=Streptomyces sp. DT2A-34 TaxID=3051182 RepID=UPI00265C59A9|nr:DUF692 family multinuclear iron-containing protein [Streptomyces sp. DT2A-34]MDO0910883.1 DUF692 family protein [Streptomyces sp. DT2A-34]
MERLGKRLGTGIGWRPEIADAVERMPGIDWVEAVAENVCPGHLPESLVRLRQRGVTVIPHGVSLGLGGADRPDAERLAALAERVEALGSPLVTEHIAFVRAGGPLTASPRLEAGHLLPVPRTRDALDVLCENVRIAQDALPVPLAVENIAALISWPGEEMTEGQFLYDLADRTGVRLLIDVANLHTNHVNRGEDPARALAELPLEAIAYVHVAGGFERDGVWHDSHAHPIPQPVLDILTDLASRVSPPGVLLERDENFPEPAELERELGAIRGALEKGGAGRGVSAGVGAEKGASAGVGAEKGPSAGVGVESGASAGGGAESGASAEWATGGGATAGGPTAGGASEGRSAAEVVHSGEASGEGAFAVGGSSTEAFRGSAPVAGASQEAARQQETARSEAVSKKRALMGGASATETAEGSAPVEGAPREAAGQQETAHSEEAPRKRAVAGGATATETETETETAEGSAPAEGAPADVAREQEPARQAEAVREPEGAAAGALADPARQRLALAQAALLSALVAGTPVPEGFDRVRLGVQARALAGKRADVVAKVAPELPVILGDGYRRAFLAYSHGHPMTDGYRRDALDFAGYLLAEGRLEDPRVRAEVREWWLERSGPKPRSRRPGVRLARATRRVLLRR